MLAVAEGFEPYTALFTHLWAYSKIAVHLGI